MFVDHPPTVELASRDQAIQPGQTTRLVWTTTDAQYAAIDNGIGYLPANGSVAVAPVETTTYTITVTGRGAPRRRASRCMSVISPCRRRWNLPPRR